MEESLVQWSDLPHELWELIGNRLETEIDIIRFRSVCSSWRRASLPPINAVCPHLSTLNDFPFPGWNSDSCSPCPFPRPENFGGVGTSLRRKTIFHMIPLRSDFGNKKQGGKLQFMELFSSRLMYDKEALGKEGKSINLLDFRIYQVAESYNLEFPPYPPLGAVHKAIIFPNSDLRNINLTIVAIYKKNLMFAKNGDDYWTLIDECNHTFDDVIVHKKKIYAINLFGEISRIDYCSGSGSMKLVNLSVPQCVPRCGRANEKHLVECGGELYLVVRFLLRVHDSLIRPKQVIDLKVYKLELLDEEDDGRWVEVDNLGNCSFVLRFRYSFSIDEGGLQPNCIYFNPYKGFGPNFDPCQPIRDQISFVFDLKQRTFANLL